MRDVSAGAGPWDLDAVERELAELSAHLDAAIYRQLTLIRIVDESGHWFRQGAKTCAHRSRAADRADVVVHLTPNVLEEGYETTLDDGTRVSAETFRRLACDCSVLSILKNGEGSVLDIGRKSRNISAAIRRAVRLRDGGCAFPGCAHDRFIQDHHCQHWVDGGETSLANLVALCTFHHRFVHEGGWRVEMVNGAPRFIAPSGELAEAAPAPARAPVDPLGAFEAQHAELDIHDETGLTRWDGTRPDYPACVASVCALDDDALDLPVAEWLARSGYPRQ